jgi:hypothetical protein
MPLALPFFRLPKNTRPFRLSWIPLEKQMKNAARQQRRLLSLLRAGQSLLKEKTAHKHKEKNGHLTTNNSSSSIPAAIVTSSERLAYFEAFLQLKMPPPG